MAKLSLFVGSGDLIKVGCGWLWVMGENYSWSLVVAVKLWLVVGGGCKGMPIRGWSGFVAAKLWEVEWVVAGGRG